MSEDLFDNIDLDASRKPHVMKSRGFIMYYFLFNNTF